MNTLTCHQNLVSELGHMIIIETSLSWLLMTRDPQFMWTGDTISLSICFFPLALFNLHPIWTLSLAYLTHHFPNLVTPPLPDNSSLSSRSQNTGQSTFCVILTLPVLCFFSEGLPCISQHRCMYEDCFYCFWTATYLHAELPVQIHVATFIFHLSFCFCNYCPPDEHFSPSRNQSLINMMQLRHTNAKPLDGDVYTITRVKHTFSLCIPMIIHF